MVPLLGNHGSPFKSAESLLAVGFQRFFPFEALYVIYRPFRTKFSRCISCPDTADFASLIDLLGSGHFWDFFNEKFPNPKT